MTTTTFAGTAKLAAMLRAMADALEATEQMVGGRLRHGMGDGWAQLGEAAQTGSSLRVALHGLVPVPGFEIAMVNGETVKMCDMRVKSLQFEAQLFPAVIDDEFWLFKVDRGVEPIVVASREADRMPGPQPQTTAMPGPRIQKLGL